ncbi:MAG TPA: hypothetical protein VGE74_29535 [Gemmata sp.]
MRFVAIALVVVGCAAGCSSDKPDNSKIQSPADQPIGAPKGLSGGKSGNLEAPPGKLEQGGAGARKPLPKIEVKP